jgi:hypothetical protein
MFVLHINAAQGPGIDPRFTGAEISMPFQVE